MTFIRIECGPADTLATIAAQVFKKMPLDAYGEAKQAYDISDLYPGEIGVEDFIREISAYRDDNVPIVVVDEFNELSEKTAPILMANIVKTIAKTGSYVTLIVLGVVND